MSRKQSGSLGVVLIAAGFAVLAVVLASIVLVVWSNAPPIGGYGP